MSFPSVMTHNFSNVPHADIRRSVFDRSHGYKTTFDAGWLIPIYVDEALPGDSLTLNLSAMMRLATPEKPIMDNMFADFFFFDVPIRLIWNNWERFNGAQDNPADTTDYTVPVMTAPASTGHAIGSLSDYLGIPTGIATLEHNSLWHRAYNLIYNTWFRDQNLQTWGDVWSRLGKYASDAMDTAEGGVETLKRTYKDAVDWLNQKFSKPSTAKQRGGARWSGGGR